MNIRLVDMDRDGDEDLLFSDRKDGVGASHSSVAWLENPGTRIGSDDGVFWIEHAIGMSGEEPMFVDVGDIDGDGKLDIVSASALPGRWPSIFFGLDSIGERFQQVQLYLPGLSKSFGIGKAVAIADMNNDARMDIVYTSEMATGDRAGIVLLEHRGNGRNSLDWTFTNISGPAGTKFDLATPTDLDADGDLDVITTEEGADGCGIGVVWYENPLL